MSPFYMINSSHMLYLSLSLSLSLSLDVHCVHVCFYLSPTLIVFILANVTQGYLIAGHHGKDKNTSISIVVFCVLGVTVLILAGINCVLLLHIRRSTGKCMTS